MQGQVYKEDQAAEQVALEKRVRKLGEQVERIERLLAKVLDRTRWMKTY